MTRNNILPFFILAFVVILEPIESFADNCSGQPTWPWSECTMMDVDPDDGFCRICCPDWAEQCEVPPGGTGMYYIPGTDIATRGTRPGHGANFPEVPWHAGDPEPNLGWWDYSTYRIDVQIRTLISTGFCKEWHFCGHCRAAWLAAPQLIRASRVSV
jgi:hypothetical protein